MEWLSQNERDRREKWNDIVLGHPELNDPDIQSSYLKTGIIPSTLPTGGDVRTDVGSKTSTGGDSTGKGATVQFPETDVGMRPIRIGPEETIPGYADRNKGFVPLANLPKGPVQILSTPTDKEDLLSGDQLKSLESGDVSQIATAFPQGVPAKVMEQFLKLKELNTKKGEGSDTKSENEQNKLEDEFKKGLTSIRGDHALARVEDQRDAAITAYGTISSAEKKGRTLNPIEYVDTLAQIYRARTGAVPGEQVLQDMRQQTAKGNLGKVYTYFTGDQAPASTEDIMKSLKDLVIDMGTLADKQHESYMGQHLLPPKNLKRDYSDRIIKEGRGLSFQDATGYTPDENAPKTVNSQAEYDALPSGTEYVDSNGKRARKR